MTPLGYAMMIIQILCQTEAKQVDPSHILIDSFAFAWLSASAIIGFLSLRVGDVIAMTFCKSKWGTCNPQPRSPSTVYHDLKYGP